MSIKRKALAAATVLTLAGGLSTAGTEAASAATPQCSAVNQNCVEVYSMNTPRRPAWGSWRPCCWGSRCAACRPS